MDAVVILDVTRATCGDPMYGLALVLVGVVVGFALCAWASGQDYF